ncbi:isoprenylcysteine carboxylmethyltransferase family protein [Candidatus Bathyarchaeota archaeon]|nr:isoprenylcysteine carboxylmethyltransferase family protein [Candidatus Bathyarchaeota archaeon]
MRINSMELPKIKKSTLILYLLIFVFAPIITFSLGSFLDELFRLPKFPNFPYNLIFGTLIFFSGLFIGLKSTRLLYNLGYGLPWGELQSNSQSKKLVTTGLYAYTRNPMILGYSMLPCGMGIMFQSLTMSIIIPLTIVMLNILIVKLREEPHLEVRFGEEYRIYKHQTPFIVPNFTRLIKEKILKMK